MSGGGSRNPTPPIGRPTSTPTPPQVSRVSMVVVMGTGSLTATGSLFQWSLSVLPTYVGCFIA